MPALPVASLFGKLPSALDFVRIHHTYPEALALDRWLAASQQYLQARGHGWPQESLYFCFVPEGAEHGLLGVLAPSRDRAGRKYPAAIFSPLPRAVIDAHYPALPLTGAQYLDAAEALLERAASAPRAELEECLTRLPLLASEVLSEDYEALNRHLNAEQRPSACERSHDDAARWLWLTQLNDPTPAPTFLWHPELIGRLLIGPPGNDTKLLARWSEKRSAEPHFG